MTGIEIFKLLPKTNCKECGHPTCLAFAMKLAQRQASVDQCPDLSEEIKAILTEASAPPIRTVSFGTNNRVIKMGGEIVLFRHEKKFVNPTVFAVEIKDTESADSINSIVDDVLSSEIERVGQRLRIDAILITHTSGDSQRFEQVVKTVSNKAAEVPLILYTTDPSAAESALKIVGDKRPILHGATKDNLETMADISKRYKIPLGLKAEELEELSILTKKLNSLGVNDLILDTGAKNARQILEHNTYIRRLTLKRNFKDLGYPVINFCQRKDSLLESLIAGLGVMKYASIVVLSSAEKWKNLALFTLRQNIYTDPQIPMQVEQKIYKIGEPKTDSPLLITTNFSLTYFIVSGEIENSKVPSRLAVMDCEGLSVLTAWAAGKFTAAKISQFIKDSGIENEISHRELIIPGYVAILKGAIEERLPQWKITVGPREASGIPAFLRQRHS